MVDIDQVGEEYFRHIRINQTDVFQPDSDGDLYLQLDSIYDEFVAREAKQKHDKTISKKPRPTRWEDFCRERFNRNIPDSRRFLTLLNNPFWREFARKFCAYDFGREVFKAHHLTAAVGHRLDEVRSLSYIRTIVRDS